MISSFIARLFRMTLLSSFAFGWKSSCLPKKNHHRQFTSLLSFSSSSSSSFASRLLLKRYSTTRNNDNDDDFSNMLISDALWMPWTANRAFRESPKIVTRANGMYLYTVDNTNNKKAKTTTTTSPERPILDATSGLWCCNLGHCRSEIADAVSKQLRQLDFMHSFNMGHNIAFEYANRLVEHTPNGLDHVFFGTSGSDAIETALKIAMQYWRVRGQGQRHKFIGRKKSYHGVNFGGISVGGLTYTFENFGQWLPTYHMKHTLDIQRNSCSRGLPEHGGIELADELEDIVSFCGSSNVAAVVIEPIAGSGGSGVVLPPRGYLQRIREICTKYEILLIFDETITGWGRTGSAFAATEFDVLPDIITSAKGITNAAIPLSAVFVNDEIYNTCIHQSKTSMEFYHGYTYSCHPVACAAGMACLDIYEREGLLTRASGSIGQYWEDALHSLADMPQIIDIRNYGLLGAVELRRPTTIDQPLGPLLQSLAWEKGVLVRGLEDAVCMSPPLIVDESHIDNIIQVLREIINTIPCEGILDMKTNNNHGIVQTISK